MRKLIQTTAAIVFSLSMGMYGVAHADSSDKPSAEQVQKIMDLLESMRCEMDEDDIEIDGDEIELDDVFCGGGQFDIDLNEDMHITGMKAE